MEDRKGILWIAINYLVNAEHPVAAAHNHITLKFGINEKDVQHLVDRKVSVWITESCSNERIQAVKVILPENVKCNNLQPHMTVSMQAGVKPVESNDMFAEGVYKSERVDSLVEGIIEFFPFNKKS